VSEGERRFSRDSRGAAAVEFAFIATVLMGALVLVVDGWALASGFLDMRAGLRAGSRYYMTGGTSDSASREVVLVAWRDRPGDSVVEVSRSCRCGEAATQCGTLCPDRRPPATYVQLTATTETDGLLMSPRFRESQVVRVR